MSKQQAQQIAEAAARQIAVSTAELADALKVLKSWDALEALER